MGCCHGREDRRLQKTSRDTESLANASASTKDDHEKQIDEFEARAGSIEKIVDSLLLDSRWRTDVQEPFVTIRSLKGSCLNSFIPVVHIQLDLDRHVPPGIVLDYLNNPEVRMRWETNYRNMSVVKKYSGWQFISAVVIKIDVPLISDREFVEHKLMRQTGNSTKVIINSVAVPVSSM